MSFLREVHSADAQSKTWDWLRCYGGVVVLVGLGAFCGCLIAGLSVDWIIAYGTGFGGLLFGVAGGQWVRKDRENPE